MKYLCTNCGEITELTDKIAIHEAPQETNYPFIGLKHVYRIKYFQCPICNELCEIERILVESWKDGKQVTLNTPL